MVPPAGTGCRRVAGAGTPPVAAWAGAGRRALFQLDLPDFPVRKDVGWVHDGVGSR